MNKRIRKKHQKIWDYYSNPKHLDKRPIRNYGLNIFNARLCDDIKKMIDDYFHNVKRRLKK